MATASIITKDSINTDGTVSVILRIIHNRKQYKKTLYRIPDIFWDRKKKEVRRGCQDYISINQHIIQELTEAKQWILSCGIRRLPVDPHAYLHNPKTGADIISHLEVKILSIDEPRTRAKYSTCIRRIQEAGLNVELEQVNDAWIKAFEMHLRSKGNENNTRAKYISAIGSVFTLAKRKGLITVNPFEGRPKKETPSKKAKLTLVEFRRIELARFQDERLENIRRMFTFAVLARGIRAFDILTLTWSNINDDRLTYRAQKAKQDEDGKEFDIKITPAMAACIEGLDRDNEYVFPFVWVPKKLYATNKHEYKKHVASVLTPVNEDLKVIAALCEINKRISMHVARHTFAFLCSEARKPIAVIQSLLGHSDMQTTKTYIEAIRNSEELDKAVEEVF